MVSLLKAQNKGKFLIICELIQIINNQRKCPIIYNSMIKVVYFVKKNLKQVSIPLKIWSTPNDAISVRKQLLLDNKSP